MLCNPITSKDELNNYYDMIDDLIKIPNLLVELENSLKKISDIERHQRKLQLCLIKPNEFVNLFRSYLEIVSIYTLIIKSKTSFIKVISFLVQK